MHAKFHAVQQQPRNLKSGREFTELIPRINLLYPVSFSCGINQGGVICFSRMDMGQT